MPSPSTRDNAPFRLLTLSAFLAPTLPRLVTKGMFLDGMLYAVIARNMAAGLGSFWKPVLTPTLTAEFWAEHPPLGLGIESIFFRVFGDHLWVESLHSLVMAAATAALIIAVWRRVTRGATGLASMEWLPVLAWAMMPQIAWSYSNNMLENTLSVFVLGAVWFLLVAWDARGARALAATLGAAACIVAGLFTKGVVALFPLAFLPVLAAVGRGRGRDAVYRTVALSVLVALLVACVLIADGARENIQRYLDTQLVASLEGKRGAVAHRFGIVRKLVLEMAPPVGCALVVAAIAGWRRRRVREDDGAGFVAGAGTTRTGWAFVVLGLCGSLPLVVSPRQSGFYIVPSFPMFALGLALLTAPAVRALVHRDTPHGRPWSAFTLVSAVLLASVLVFSAGRAGSIGRDRATIEDVRRIGAAVGERATVGLCPAMARNWGLHGYFARYYNVSLDPDAPGTHEFVVTGKAPCTSLDLSSRDPVALETETLFLYQRR